MYNYYNYIHISTSLSMYMYVGVLRSYDIVIPR